MHLEEILDVKIPVTEFKGDIHMSDIENWMSQVQEIGVFQDFWILMAEASTITQLSGGTLISKVVDHFKDKLLFVQCGQADHFHPPLKGVVSLIGKRPTTVYTSYVPCKEASSAWAMHLAAAVELKK